MKLTTTSSCESALENTVRTMLIRYYHRGERSAEILVSPEEVQIDGAPAYIRSMLKQTTPHDDDYHIFRMFQAPDDIILDVGAHWGYSVGSLLAVGVGCRVVSFEAISLHGPCLETVRQAIPYRYAYRLVGLSDCTGCLTFVIPAVNGRAIGGLASAEQNPNIDRMTENVCDHIHRWMPWELSLSVKLCEVHAPVDLLDRQMESGILATPSRIVGIKVDVEGLEFAVLRGAEATLTRHTPLVMVEGGNRETDLVSYMAELGYVYAERNGMAMGRYAGFSRSCNGFFVHQQRVETYRQMAIFV